MSPDTPFGSDMGPPPLFFFRSFAFTGPDGIRYRWALGCMGMNYPRVRSYSPRTKVLS